MYDSSIDAHYHIYNIQWVWANLVRPALDVRFDVHDQSKLESPEKECYDKYIPLLKKYKFGTPESNQVKKAWLITSKSIVTIRSISRMESQI